jgi:putative RecB family exonuclease
VAAVPTLSYSSVRAYLECPLRWKFLYIDRLPETPRGYFSFGRTVHSVLEELLRPLVLPGRRSTSDRVSQATLDDYPGSAGTATPGRLRSREEMLEIYRSSWVGDGYTSAEEERRYRQLGEEILLKFHDSISATPPTPIAVEAHLEATWDDVPVHGYIDRIDRTPGGGLEIVDYKTSRELSMEDAEGSDQLALYQVLVEKNYRDPVERLTLYHLRSQTPHSVARRARPALSDLHARVVTVRDGIRTESYEPTPGRQCGRCEFRGICPEFKEVPAGERERLKELVDRFESLRADERRLEGELAHAAQELHRAAERLGVHRVPGSRGVAIRRREENWRYPEDRVRGILTEGGQPEMRSPLDSEAIRRLLRDPSFPPEVKRKISELGSRDVRWYWTLEDS